MTITGQHLERGHLRDYWRVVWNGRWTALSIFAVVVVIGTVATLLQKPTYEAMATLELNARPRGVVPGAEVAQLGATEFGYLAEERYFNTQHQILRSRSLASAVMTQLDLYGSPAFSELDDPERGFIERIIVDPVQETGVVRVRVRAGDPEDAALWANTVTRTYVQRNLAKAVRTTEEAVNALMQHLQPLKVKLLESDQARLQFAGDQNIVVSDNPQRNLQERLKLLQEDLTDIQVKRLGLQGIHETLREIRQAGGDFMTVPRVADSPTLRALNTDRTRLETALNKLLVTFKPGHFKVKEKQSELAKVEAKIDGEVLRVVSAVQTEYSLAVSQEEEIESQIVAAQVLSVDLGRRASAYDMLTGESSETRRIYELISTRIKEIQLNTNLLRNNVSVLDEAFVPKSPVSPRRRLNVALAVIIGLLLGLGTVFFLDYLDNTVKTSEDVEQYLKLNILAVIPRGDKNNEPMIKESFQSLRTNLHFSSLNRSLRIILVTSAAAQEGKTSTSVALARTLAGSGDRVILLDCDLRRPNVHNHLNIKRNFGLTNFLSDASEGSSWRKYLKAADTPNLHVLTCGPIPPNPPELFGTARFRAMLQEMKEAYDWVVIDSPPVAALTDSVILASLAEMITLVVRHRGHDRELIRRSVEALRAVNEHVAGVILNDVDLGRTHYRDYYYAGHYYYGASEQGETEATKVAARRKVG